MLIDNIAPIVQKDVANDASSNTKEISQEDGIFFEDIKYNCAHYINHIEEYNKINKYKEIDEISYVNSFNDYILSRRLNSSILTDDHRTIKIPFVTFNEIDEFSSVYLINVNVFIKYNTIFFNEEDRYIWYILIAYLKSHSDVLNDIEWVSINNIRYNMNDIDNVDDSVIHYSISTLKEIRIQNINKQHCKICVFNDICCSSI
jgi:hypothetical protein